MAFVVSKTINTAISRLKVGHPVSASDYLLPHSFDDLVARGFIKSASAAPIAPAAPLASIPPSAPVKAAE